MFHLKNVPPDETVPSDTEAPCTDGIHCEAPSGNGVSLKSKGLLEDPMDFVKSGPMDRWPFHVPCW